MNMKCVGPTPVGSLLPGLYLLPHLPKHTFKEMLRKPKASVWVLCKNTSKKKGSICYMQNKD